MREKKVIKYLILLLSIFILNWLAKGPFQSYLYMLNFSMTDTAFIMKIIPYILNFIIAVFLLIDCKKATKNYITIPLLGLLMPIIGICFYLIDSELLNNKEYNGNI